ncbi:At-hook motif nuclear-localized protein [Thalictrum thalictroides]|uniref:At-hook motif nuclear-localized protein n=1 Tax=Thalictrum thalictroides TaxID=46969 RepID=A0A7J6VD21_THATH|nr:At-hook motif nuclear-localized protein [Thalictrum thalictroides]
MKGSSDHLFEEVKLKPTNTNNNSSMFSKLHSRSPLLTHHPQTHSFQQQLSQQLTQQECHNNNNTSEDDRSPSSGGATVAGTGDQVGGIVVTSGGSGVGSFSKKIKTSESGGGGYSGGGGGGYSGGGGGDGASIEVSRRPRGRPPGSKNKPKPPIIITRDTECAMRPHILEISSGLDIIDSIVRFSRQRNVGLCVLTASGSVLNVSLRQPTPGSTVTFHGRFDILSISATYLPPSSLYPSSSSSSSNGGGVGCTTTISLAGPQGQIFGGSVVGALIASSNVFIVATSFSSPTYHRLPVQDEEIPNTSDTQVGTPMSGSAGGVESHSGGTDPGAMTIYNCSHLPNDVIWTPTARPPPPSQHF